jgi:hypothetical protein
MISNFSDYLVFADESGDHSLSAIDPNYPIFVLAFIIIHKDEYINNLLPKIQNLKLEIWGHEQVILHEREIRQKERDFTLLNNREINNYFLGKLTNIISEVDFKIISSIVCKNKLKEKYTTPHNPYDISLLFCMETILDYLCKYNQKSKDIYINFESRGKDEDKSLELEFLKIATNQKTWGYKNKDFKQVSFIYKSVSKRCNSAGLQLADLIARPIGTKYLNPNTDNRAINILENKILKRKVFP